MVTIGRDDGLVTVADLRLGKIAAVSSERAGIESVLEEYEGMDRSCYSQFSTPQGGGSHSRLVMSKQTGYVRHHLDVLPEHLASRTIVAAANPSEETTRGCFKLRR